MHEKMDGCDTDMLLGDNPAFLVGSAKSNMFLVLRTANTAPVWRGGTHYFCTRSGR